MPTPNHVSRRNRTVLPNTTEPTSVVNTSKVTEKKKKCHRLSFRARKRESSLSRFAKKNVHGRDSAITMPSIVAQLENRWGCGGWERWRTGPSLAPYDWRRQTNVNKKTYSALDKITSTMNCWVFSSTETVQIKTYRRPPVVEHDTKGLQEMA